MITNTKSFMQRREDVQRQWHLIDAKDQILGRLATQIATLLIGKNKPTYSPHVDGGDFVVIINAAQVKLTRNKAESKLYHWHSGFPGGLKEINFKDALAKRPEFVFERAVKNMLPKNRQQDKRMARLKIYATAEHPHQSQFEKNAE